MKPHRMMYTSMYIYTQACDKSRRGTAAFPRTGLDYVPELGVLS